MPMLPLQVYLHALNMEETVTFYREVMGFKVTNTMTAEDGRLGHAEFEQGGVHLMFGPASAMEGEPPACYGGGVTLYLRLDGEDVDEYYNRVVARGAQIVMPLADQPWGDRSFVALDPTGYALMVARPGMMPHDHDHDHEHDHSHEGAAAAAH